jgi:hypothetical protein
MGTPIFKHKRRMLMFFLALLGFAIAAVIWAYAELTDSSPPHVNVPLWAGFALLCPAALLSVPLIDVEPGTTDFLITWLIIGVVNSALYAVVGLVVGRFLWKPERN